MTEPNTNIDNQNQPSRSIPECIAVPMLMFSGPLFVLLLLSWMFVLPRFTSVRVAGETFSPREAATYEKQLRASLITMEDDRRALVLPAHDALYDQVKMTKSDSVTIEDIRSMLRRAAVETDESDAIVFTKISFNGQSVEVTGDVRNVGLRSMTVLAAFSEALSAEAHVTAFKRPQFTRQEDENGDVHSPFTISFTLTSAQH